MNRLLLSACLIERQALRYTPAGLPALDMLLLHESELTQEGQARKVKVEVRARAIGSVVRPLAALAIGSEAEFAGFLGSQRNGRGTIFHIQEFEAKPGTGGLPAPDPDTD